MQDTFGRGSIASVLADARATVGDGADKNLRRVRGNAHASLKNPSRPFTPADHSRGLTHSFLSNQDAGPPPGTPMVDADRSGTLLTRPAQSLKRFPAEKSPASENTAPADKNSPPLVDNGQYDRTSDAWRVVQPAVSAIEQHTAPAETALDMLSRALEEKACRSLMPAQKQEIIGALEPLLEDAKPVVLLKLARILLRLECDCNLFDVCKSLYKLSKDKSNDTIFAEHGLLQPLVHALRRTETVSETGVFLTATIKNLTNDEKGLQIMASAGLVSELSGALARVAASAAPMGAAPKWDLMLTSQLLHALRNCAQSSALVAEFSKNRVVSPLCKLMEVRVEHEDTMLNIARILGKLSNHAECREQLVKHPTGISSLLKSLQAHPNTSALVLRVCFTLGNLSTNSDTARAACVQQKYGGIGLLLGLLRQSIASFAESRNSADAGTSSEPTDVLVKLVRLLANLSISRGVGREIGRAPDLALLVHLLEESPLQNAEELILNIVSALTNLSFYCDDDNVAWKERFRICKAVAPMLLSSNDEAVVEASRAYGNLSRDAEVCDLMAAERIDETLVILLDHSNNEVVFAVTGALMNLAARPEHKRLLLEQGAIEKVIAEVATHQSDNLSFLNIAFKFLFNFTLDGWDAQIPQWLASLLCETLEQMHHRGALMPSSNVPKERDVATPRLAARREKQKEEQLAETIEVAHRLHEALQAALCPLEPLEPAHDETPETEAT